MSIGDILVDDHQKPEQIGRYKVLRNLDGGAMADVFLATDPTMNREVVIKVLPRRPKVLDSKYRARFEREVQIIIKLEHPGIVPVYDFGYYENYPYIVMRYMSGGTLRNRLKAGSFSVQETLTILEQLGPALDYIHQEDIIHRDLKPANILFDQMGNAFIADFGIAKVFEPDNELTGEASPGTPDYMSPEQIRSDETIDRRSDIYAMGVILFEMLTGSRPYTHPTAHLIEPIPNILSYRKDLPWEYEFLIYKILAKERHERFETMSKLVKELKKALQQIQFENAITLSKQEKDTVPFAESKFSVRKNYSLIARFIGLTIFISLVVLFGLWGYKKLNEPAQLTVALFPEDKYGIIISEFSLGAEERKDFSGGVEVRDKIYAELQRLIAQQELSNQVVIQQSDPIKTQEQALRLGAETNADLVIWGYVPITEQNSFRPTFSVTSSEPFESFNPALFNVEITAEDIIAASDLLTARVKVVASYILGIYYFKEGGANNLSIALAFFDRAISEGENELSSANINDLEDFKFNLAWFYLMRGKTYDELGDSEQALVDFNKSLEYRTNFFRANIAIGNLYYSIRDFETAYLYYEKARTSWEGLHGLGLVAYYQMDYSEAIHYFEEAIPIVQSEDTVQSKKDENLLLFLIGMAYKAQGKFIEADEFLSEVCNAQIIDNEFRKGVCSELGNMWKKVTEMVSASQIPPTFTPSPTETSTLPSSSPQSEMPLSSPTLVQTSTETQTPTQTLLPFPTATQLPTPKATRPPPTLLPNSPEPPTPTLLPNSPEPPTPIPSQP